MIKIIEALETAMPNKKIIPTQSKNSDPCIIYKWYQVSFLQYRLELRIIEKTFSECEAVAKTIMNTINDFGDANKIENISSIELNGGGDLIDNSTNTTQRLMYFDVIMN